MVNDRTRLVAVTAASNLLGTHPPVARIAQRAHEVGALVHVDGVHHAAHAAPDLTALGADLLVCSPYKFFGPHCAVLAADPALLETLRPDKLLPSTRRRARALRARHAALRDARRRDRGRRLPRGPRPGGGSRRERLVAAYALIQDHELRLRARLEEGLAALGERVTVHSRAADRTSTLFLTFRDHEATAVAEGLVERDVLVPPARSTRKRPFVH